MIYSPHFTHVLAPRREGDAKEMEESLFEHSSDEHLIMIKHDGETGKPRAPVSFFISLLRSGNIFECSKSQVGLETIDHELP